MKLKFLKMFTMTAAVAAALTFSACGDDSPSGPTSSVNNDWRNYCIDAINKYRATEDAAPLKLAADDKLDCIDKQTANDLKTGKAHGHFGDCKESAQNSGPNISLARAGSDSSIVDTYLEMMWDEKKLVESGEKDPDKKEDYPSIGHYLNMRNTRYTSAACSIAKSADGKTGWFNVNFY